MTTDSELKLVVTQSTSFVDVCRKLNVSTNGRPYRRIRNKIKNLNLDTTHFTPYKNASKLKAFPLEDLLFENKYFPAHRIKKKLIAAGIKEDICEIKGCGVGAFWNGKPITLELDHINGINDDNRIENLRIICPNCHSQTETYRSKKLKTPKGK